MDFTPPAVVALTSVDVKPIIRVIKTMLEDKDVCVRRLREGYEFFKSMAQRRNDLEAARSAAYFVLRLDSKG